MQTLVGILTFVSGSHEYFMDIGNDAFLRIRFINPETEVELNTKIALSVVDLVDEDGAYWVPDMERCYAVLQDG